MAALSDREQKPETKIESDWSGYCKNNNPIVSKTNVDSIDRPLPENAFMLSDLFTPQECHHLINAAETSAGFGYTNYRKEYRGNLRLITTDVAFTKVMWERIKPFMPTQVTVDGEQWEASGMNECWRLSKYHPGDRFGTHYDANFERSKDEQSLYTVNAYMNSEFEGGKTRFYTKLRNGEEIASIKGVAGSCLIFMQPPGDQLAHDGEQVKSGLKYLFRSDVMYKRMKTQQLMSADTADEEDDPNDHNRLAMLKQAQDLESASKFQEANEIYTRLKMFYPAVAEKHKSV